MTPDEKVENYLDRAKEILKDKLPHGDNYSELIVGTVEIAKMIQLEEHNQPKIISQDISKEIPQTREALETLDALDKFNKYRHIYQY